MPKSKEERRAGYEPRYVSPLPPDSDKNLTFLIRQNAVSILSIGSGLDKELVEKARQKISDILQRIGRDDCMNLGDQESLRFIEEAIMMHFRKLLKLDGYKIQAARSGKQDQPDSATAVYFLPRPENEQYKKSRQDGGED